MSLEMTEETDDPSSQEEVQFNFNPTAFVPGELGSENEISTHKKRRASMAACASCAQENYFDTRLIQMKDIQNYICCMKNIN